MTRPLPEISPEVTLVPFGIYRTEFKMPCLADWKLTQKLRSLSERYDSAESEEDQDEIIRKLESIYRSPGFKAFLKAAETPSQGPIPLIEYEELPGKSGEFEVLQPDDQSPERQICGLAGENASREGESTSPESYNRFTEAERISSGDELEPLELRDNSDILAREYSPEYMRTELLHDREFSLKVLAHKKNLDVNDGVARIAANEGLARSIAAAALLLEVVHRMFLTDGCDTHGRTGLGYYGRITEKPKGGEKDRRGEARRAIWHEKYLNRDDEKDTVVGFFVSSSIHHVRKVLCERGIEEACRSPIVTEVQIPVGYEEAPHKVGRLSLCAILLNTYQDPRLSQHARTLLCKQAETLELDCPGLEADPSAVAEYEMLGKHRKTRAMKNLIEVIKDHIE